MQRRWWPRRLPLAALSVLALLALGSGGCSARAGTVAAPPSAATGRTESAGLRVDFLDVGHGDAILITSPTGKTVLVDGGMPNTGERVAAFVGARTTAPIDLVVLTHRHADHLGGLATVIARLGARAFMDAVYPHPSPGYDNLLRVLHERRIPVREAQRGRVVDLGGGARLVLLTPPAPLITGSRSDVNANCLVARLELGQVRMLLTGDAEAVTEDWLLRSNVDLRADVLKLAHHGGRHSSTARFLRAVAPRIAVASAGPGERSGTVQPETEARVQEVGARLYRTDQDGNITVWTDGRAVRVEVERRQERAAAETGP